MYSARTRLANTCLCLGATFCAAASSVPAQTSPVLTLPDGRTIEVLGLRRWTIGMLQDSLAKYAPADSLQSHACAATLRYKLHFADAASTTFTFGPDTADEIVVSVREPQDSGRVHYGPMPLDTLSTRKAWEPITTVFRHHPNVFWPEVHARVNVARGRPQYPTRDDSTLAMRFAEALGTFTRESDRLDAMRVLAASPNMYDRAAAAVILANFADRDDTWWSLVETLRESDGLVRGVAATVLVGLSRSAPRAVAWSPKAASIHAMLDGTSLFVLNDLLQVLVNTRVSPRDARALIGNGGGDMLLAYLGSRNATLARHSRALLTALRGRDLGPTVEPWRAWMSTL